MPLHMIQIDRESIGQDVRFRWNSILSGAFITLGFAVFFLVVGNAIGLNIYNSVDPNIHTGLKVWSWLYNAIAMVFSYGLGAAFSSRPNDVTSGGSQGLASWGFATVLGTLILSLVSPTARSVLSGVGPDAGNWFAAVVVVFGLFTSIPSGMFAHRMGHVPRTEADLSIEKSAGAA